MAAKAHFMNLPHLILSNANGLRRRTARMLGNLERFKEGTLPKLTPLSAPQKRAAEQRVARPVYKQLTLGHVTRAARALEAAEVAEPTPVVRASW